MSGLAHLCQPCREHRGRTATASLGLLMVPSLQQCTSGAGCSPVSRATHAHMRCCHRSQEAAAGQAEPCSALCHTPSCQLWDVLKCARMEVAFVPASATAGERKVKSSCLLPPEPLSALPPPPSPLFLLSPGPQPGCAWGWGLCIPCSASPSAPCPPSPHCAHLGM